MEFSSCRLEALQCNKQVIIKRLNDSDRPVRAYWIASDIIVYVNLKMCRLFTRDRSMSEWKQFLNGVQLAVKTTTKAHRNN